VGLTRGEIERRMEEIEVDQERFQGIKENIEEYLASGIVGSTLVGRHYTVSDPKQREELADWVTNLLVQALRYERALEDGEGEANE